MNSYFVIALGFVAQMLFFARTIAQWFKSEQQGKVISPVIFWHISLLASIIMLTYGILRNDFPIILGQILVYSIYIRNLQLKHAWRKMPLVIRILAIAIPIGYLFWLIFGSSYNLRSILKNEDVPLFWLIWGSASQIIFVSRFIYQWIYSENLNDSVLPLGFWVISSVGSLMIITYSIARLDPVLFAAHSLSFFIYLRNILLHFGKKSLFTKVGKSGKFHQTMIKVSEKLN